jgi:hypothetical protein
MNKIYGTEVGCGLCLKVRTCGIVWYVTGAKGS